MYLKMKNNTDESTMEKKILKNFALYDKTVIDQKKIKQEKLDLVNKNKKSKFQWRGQFSPELIGSFLDKFAKKDSIVLDPFVGSGTTLFESSEKFLNCVGVEINPAAVIMAETIQFVNIKPEERIKFLKIVEKLLKKYDLLSENIISENYKEMTDKIQLILKNSLSQKYVHNIISNIVLRFTNGSKKKTMLQSFEIHKEIITNLPYSKKQYKMFHSDARKIPLKDNSVDLIITSPPYINVFNYHQNYRPAIELMGWDVLGIAKSEFGSNRKHRGNRFFTVTQYAIDMFLTIKEMKRVIKKNGRMIIVIGRESSIRGMKFDNGKIVSTLAIGSGQFKLILRQERKFTNMFGKLIYEDILHFIPTNNEKTVELDLPRLVSKLLLEKNLKKAIKDVKADIKEAISKSKEIQQSVFLQASEN
jgi:DNA modification methylase